MRKKKFDYSSLWILIEVIIMLSKVCEVFTKEYRKETAYQEFTAKMIQYFKLNNNSESVEDKVERLKGKKYVSNFWMNIGEYKK